ncbi:hypothetical protein RhiirB3_171486 [Rhizophagus irregularis]|nr:hypothetical protein RhiirB3_171486 [Rhizophagus irregularis]
MNQFGIMTEIEVTNGYIMNTITKVEKKPRNVTISVMEDGPLIPIKQHYRKSFEQEFKVLEGKGYYFFT